MICIALQFAEAADWCEGSAIGEGGGGKKGKRKNGKGEKGRMEKGRKEKRKSKEKGERGKHPASSTSKCSKPGQA